MKLQRRFDWKDRDSIYKSMEESEVEKATEGRVRFAAVRVGDGNVFEGVSYPTTVAQMVDSKTGFWKLAANPKNSDKSLVVDANPNLAESTSASENPSETKTPHTRGRKGD